MVLIMPVFFFQVIAAQADSPEPELTAWESEDIEQGEEEELPSAPAFSPLRSLELYFIRYYQKKISVNTISRCPFHVSCSNYAYQAIEKYGPYIGICIFIDRTFYRENPGAYFYYPLKENQEGSLKLDDSKYFYAY